MHGFWEANLNKEVAVLLKRKAPSKILIFGWRIIDKSLTCLMELSKRGVIDGRHNTCYLLCFDGEDDLEHLFLSYLV